MHTIKHFFDSVVIVQYLVNNTLEDQVLKKVKLIVNNVESKDNLELKYVASLPSSEQIKYGDKKYLYAIFSKEQCDTPFPVAKVSHKLSLQIAEIDADSKDELGSYEEDYALEDLTLAIRDYIKPYALPSGQFKEVWEAIGADAKASEIIQTFKIQFKAMDEAVAGVIKFFGMSVCEGTDKINVTEKVHNLLLSGLFFGTEIVVVRS